MGKFKDIVTNEMTTKNVNFETALIKAERAIRAQFTPEKNAAAWDKSCVDKFNEMNASPRGRFFLRKGSPLNLIGKCPDVRW